MGYKIVYGPERKHEKERAGYGVRIQTMTAAFFLLGCILVRSAWPAGTELLKSVLLPGTPSATEQAFHTLLLDLRSGEPVGESVSTFCRVVIQNGTDLEP